MTPKEKAQELYNKFAKIEFFRNTDMFEEEIREAALIATENEYNAKIQAYNEMAEFCPDVASQAAIYAEIEKQQVKKELEQLNK